MTDTDANTDTKTLIIGCGSDLRGDDALGPLVAAELEALIPPDGEVRVEICCGLTPDLAYTLAQIDTLIFIDCAAQGELGVVRRVAYHPVPEADLACVHLLDLPALLTWTQTIYGTAPRAVAFSITGEQFGLSETLSPSVAAKVPELIDSVLLELGLVPHA